MTTIYGLPAIEVMDPKGEVVLYLFATTEIQWESAVSWWQLTAPSGESRRVYKTGVGVYDCDCPAATLGRRKGGCWVKLRHQMVCKHAGAIAREFFPTELAVEEVATYRQGIRQTESPIVGVIEGEYVLSVTEAGQVAMTTQTEIPA